ncbi:Iduronate sulfatase [Planctomycetales bacterium 10988]|nr:Iduronate sulfatase [Planctomycetales bacterium 10988]
MPVSSSLYRFKFFLFLLGWILYLPTTGAGELSTPKHPNILLICVDDLRPELGCYGAEHMQTPNIDAFSESGVTFDRCYVQVAVCNPSRASMMTGIRPDRLGVWTLRIHFREAMPDAVTLPQYLRQTGYTCEGYGKIFHNPWPDPRSWDQPHRWSPGGFTHYTAEQKAFAQEVRESFPEGSWLRQNLRGLITNAPEIEDTEHKDGGLTLLAVERLKALGKQKKPFFLAVGYTLPHLAWCPPKRWWDRYDREQLPLASNPFPPKDAPQVAVGTNYEPAYYADMIDMPKPWEGSVSEETARRLRHGYFASISFIDSEIGKLLAALDAEDRADDTIVVLWSDHGYKLGEHAGWSKMTNYEIDTRIPFIIRDPRSPSNGQRCDRLVETLDLFPTLCELAGVAMPEMVDGQSAAALINDPEALHKGAAFTQFVRQQMIGNAIRTDKWRYVEWRTLKEAELKHQELYDQQNDPDENKNVFGQHPEVEADLQQRLCKVLVPHSISLIPPIRSKKGGKRVKVEWTNQHNGPVRVTWINPQGERKVLFDLPAGASRKNTTSVGHLFSMESKDGIYHENLEITDTSKQLFLGKGADDELPTAKDQ